MSAWLLPSLPLRLKGLEVWFQFGGSLDELCHHKPSNLRAWHFKFREARDSALNGGNRLFVSGLHSRRQSALRNFLSGEQSHQCKGVEHVCVNRNIGFLRAEFLQLNSLVRQVRGFDSDPAFLNPHMQF